MGVEPGDYTMFFWLEMCTYKNLNPSLILSPYEIVAFVYE
jgi:hypothetical protein